MKHEIVHCTSNWLSIVRQSWSFTDFHSNEYSCFEQSIGSNRTAGVSSTVTKRSKSWTKTCAYSFICTVSVAVSTDMGSLDLLREVSVLSEHKTLLLSIVFCSEQIPRYFAVTICLSRGFPQVFIPQNRARRISLMRFTSLDHASKLPFSFPNFSFVPDASWEFLVCPAEAFNPNSSSFRRKELTGSESWETQPWTFVFCLTTATVPWVPSFSRTRAEVTSHPACRKKATNATNAHVSQTCNHDTRDDADNYMTIFFILSTIDKDFFTPVAGLAFRLFEFFTSVRSFTFGPEEGTLVLGEIFLASFTSFHIVSRRPVACVYRKLQLSPFEQNPLVFRWKHSSFPLGVGFCPLPCVTSPLRKLLLGNSQFGSEILFGQGITDAFPEWR